MTPFLVADVDADRLARLGLLGLGQLGEVVEGHRVVGQEPLLAKFKRLARLFLCRDDPVRLPLQRM